MAGETATTFEAAKHCPKCNMPGEDRSTTPSTNSEGLRVALHFIWCVNPECSWYNTNWIVQINPDGSIPAPYSQIGEKKYPKLNPAAQTAYENMFERQLEAEVQPGAEVRNPRDPRA